MVSEDFDEPVDRSNTASDKWDLYAGRDVLPMWVADMDLRAPRVVLDALHERVDHGVFGYTHAPDELIDVTREMLARKYGWSVEPDWLIWLPGLVSGLHLACATGGDGGDEILVMTPIYPPFRVAPGRVRRRLVEVPLADTAGSIDFAALEAAITPRSRVLMLCNPQNPTGRVYSPDELTRVAEFCRRHDLLLVSDEIHFELIMDEGVDHYPVAALDPAVARQTITLLAPSKTYNIAGLGCSLAVIPDGDIRRRFKAARAGIVPAVNTLGFTAALAAWRDGEGWRRELLAYLRENRDRVVAAVRAHPGLAMEVPQATYLAWIDARGLGHEDPHAAFEAAGLGLSDGREFAAPGFVRLNFGCSRATLEEGLLRLRAVEPGKTSRCAD